MLKTANGVRYRGINDGVIYHDQDVFEANEVTIRILELCKTPKMLTDVINLLHCEYDVALEVLSSDIKEATDRLCGMGLLKEVGDV